MPNKYASPRPQSSSEPKRPFAFTMMLILVPIYVGRIQEILPIPEYLPVAKIAMVVALLAYRSNIKAYGGPHNDLTAMPQFKYIMAIFCLALVGAPFGDWPADSLDAVFNSFLKLIIFIYLLVKCVADEGALLQVIWSLCLSAVALSTAALLNPLKTDGRVYVSDTYDPNDLALTLCVILPLMFYLQENSTGVKRIFILAAMAMLGLVVIKTGSRGGLITLCAISALLLYQKGPRYAVKRIPLILVFAVIFMLTAPREQLDRMLSVFGLQSDAYQTAPADDRIVLWKLTQNVMLENPLLGCGMGQLSNANGRAAGGNWHTAHNAYLQVGAELGVFGLWSFLAMLFFSWRSLRRERYGFQRPWIVDGLSASLLGLCVGSMFLSWAFTTATYFIVALTVVVHKISLQNRRAHVEQSTELPDLAPGIPETARPPHRGGARTRVLCHMRPF